MKPAKLIEACQAIMKAEEMQKGLRGGYIMGVISTAIDKAREALADGPGITVKIWTLHTRLKSGGDFTEVHFSRAGALISCLILIRDVEKRLKIDATIKLLDLDTAEEEIAKELNNTGHEWSIDSHDLDVAKAQTVPA